MEDRADVQDINVIRGVDGKGLDIFDAVEDLENVKMLQMKKDVVVLKVQTANALNQIWKTKIKKLRQRLKNSAKY